MDKTGTITENEMKAEAPEVLPGAGCSGEEIASLLGAYYRKIEDDNPTARALREAFPLDGLPKEWEAARTVPFSSERKWSAVRLSDSLAYVLGAPDLLLRALPEPQARPVLERVEALSAGGGRVVLLARHDGPMEREALSGTLTPLALVRLGNPLRATRRTPSLILPNRAFRSRWFPATARPRYPRWPDRRVSPARRRPWTLPS